VCAGFDRYRNISEIGGTDVMSINESSHVGLNHGQVNASGTIRCDRREA